MRKIYIILFFSFVLLPIAHVKCLNQTDFCYLNINSSVKCPSDKYNFQCGNVYCTIHKTACVQISIWRHLLQLIQDKKEYYSEMNSFLKFFSLIKECKSIDFKIDEACLNKDRCLGIFDKPALFRLAKGKKCECSNKNYTFYCQKNICTRNKSSCAKMSKIKADNLKAAFSLGVKSCFIKI